MAENGFYKKKNVLLKLEEIDSDVYYAITYNPCDKYQHFKDGVRLTKCIKDIHECLFYSCSVYELKLYPELSPMGRFHVHGTIKIKDPVQFCLIHVPHLTNRGTLVLKPLTNEDEWEKYCNKQALFHAYVRDQTFNSIPIKIKSML